MKFFTLAVALLIIVPISVLADGLTGESQPQGAQQINLPKDRRLPPVVPGQEVNDGAKKMNVWSTSGGVSAGPAPEPFRRERESLVDGRRAPSIIVDQRRPDDNRGR